MLLRDTTEADIPIIHAMWEGAGYSPQFNCPPDAELLKGQVATLEGNIVAWAGTELQIEVKVVANAVFTRHERSMALEQLHEPIIQSARELGRDRIYCALDPSGPGKLMAPWLYKRGWLRAMWELIGWGFREDYEGNHKSCAANDG